MQLEDSPTLTLESLSVAETPAEPAPAPAPALAELVGEPRPAPPPGPFVGDVVAARDPARPGRARVRWCEGDGVVREQWLRTLVQLGVRPGDRVLLVQPVGWSECLVSGVIDGFSARPGAEPVPAATLALQPDESVRITAADGTALVEVLQSATGPVVRLFQPDVSVELPGSLRIDARSIELHARQGGVAIQASDAVVVQGESVRLN